MSSSSRLSLLPLKERENHPNEHEQPFGQSAQDQSQKFTYSTPIDHNQPSSRPTHPSTTSRNLPSSRRSQALNLSTTQNLLYGMGEHTEDDREPGQKSGLEGENEIGVGRKLKRLSLLSKPLLSPIASAGPSRRSTETSRPTDTLEASFADIGSPSTPKPASAGMSRERSKGIRSSISYATSPTASLRSPAGIEAGREWQRGSWNGSTSAGRGSDEQKRGGVGLGLESLDEDVCGSVESTEGDFDSGAPTADKRAARATKGVTLAEKHADLLTLIAQKERKVNELKLELAQQEMALNQLKQKWTTIATRTSRPFTSQSSTSTAASSTSAQSSSSSARLPTPSTKPRTTTRPRPLDHVSAASLSSSLDQALSHTSPTSSTDPYSPAHIVEGTDSQAIITADVQAVFNNLLATAYGPEGVVTPSAVEGGKRFWGQLVKTVSAAAAGNVPGSSGTQADQGEVEQGQKSDSTTLKNIASLAGWSSLMPAPSSASTRLIRQPANSNRLPRRQDHQSTSDPATASMSPTLQTSSIDTSSMLSYQDLMDLHDAPKKENGSERKPYHQPSAEVPDEQSVRGDDGSEDEWGW